MSAIKDSVPPPLPPSPPHEPERPAAQGADQHRDAAEAGMLRAALTESMAIQEAKGLAKVAELERELSRLRRLLIWRTGSLELLLVGVAATVAVMWATSWWPW